MAALKGIDSSISTLAITNHSVFLKTAHTVTHTKAAELLRISKATESEWSSDYMERACQVLAAYGLEVVPRGSSLIPPKQVRAFIELAAAHLDRLRVESLVEQDTTPGALDE